MITSDLFYLIFTKRSPAIVLRKTEEVLENYIRKTAPKEYHEKLIPKYSPGCRRVIIDPGYLECLHKPNVDLCWEAIDAIVEDGIQLKSGDLVPLDVIILATGFNTEGVNANMRGSDGRDLLDYFESKQGPSAYLGTCVPGFPNFFLLLGPNTATGHASIIFFEEVQIQYALRLMKPVIEGLASSFEIGDEATDAYNKCLEQWHETSVTKGCTSFYRWHRNGKDFATFPGLSVYFYWLLRKTRWEDFKVVNGVKFESQRLGKSLQWKKVTLGTILVVVLAVGLAQRNGWLALLNSLSIAVA